MAESFVNQITLDCLVNKKMYSNAMMNKKKNQLNKEERSFYRKRTYQLFKEIINGKPPKDLAPDVKYAYDNFVNYTIQYFKTTDSNDILQSEYSNLDTSNELLLDTSTNSFMTQQEADLLLTRSIKIEVPTLDKYVTRTRCKKQEEIIMPQQKEVNLKDPALKNKGVK